MIRPISYMIIGLFRIYQHTLSPDTGWFKSLFPHGYCRFYPTCSEYTCRAIQKRGFIRGVARGMWRILRCNPYSQGGVDQP